MRTLALLCSVTIFLSSWSNLHREPASENFKFIKLDEGVYACIHKFGGKAICNVGVIDNGNETIIFDSFLSPEVAAELLKLLATMDLSPVKWVVNSHAHNDHIRGNQVFPSDVKIISTHKTRELIEEWEPKEIADEKVYAPIRFAYYDSLYMSFDGDKSSREYQKILMWRPYYQILSRSHLEVKTRLPTVMVDSILSLDGPARRVHLITKGQGHTDSDLVLYLPDDQILFSGDLIFNACHPYVAHGSLPKWRKWLDYMHSLDVEFVVPGHGEIGSKTLIQSMRNYLKHLETTAAEFHKDKMSPAEKTMSVPEPYSDWWFDRFYPVNVNFAYEATQTELDQR